MSYYPELTGPGTTSTTGPPLATSFAGITLIMVTFVSITVFKIRKRVVKSHRRIDK